MLVAARDEQDRLATTLAALRAAFPRATVWVADDGSLDATAQVARAGGARVVSSGRHLGKGGSVTAAAREALREAGPEALAVLCDADLGDSARELPALVDVVAGARAELAVAAFRTRHGGGFGVALGFARWAVRRRAGIELRAPLSGQRALAAATLAELLPFAPGYGMELGMTLDALRRGHRLLEVELELTHRATRRTPAGFLHRARQLLDCMRAYAARGGGGVTLRGEGGTALR